MSWMVAYTKPSEESRALAHLVRLGIEVFMPRCRVLTKKKGEPVKVRPLFPRYMFVEIFDDAQATAAAHAPGMMGLLRYGTEGRYAVVSEEIIRRIKSEMAAGGGEVAVKGDVWHDFHKDEKIRIDGGSFGGFEGLFVRSEKDRITVLLNILGRQTRMEVPEEMVKPLA